MATILYALVANADKVTLAEASMSDSKQGANAEKLLASVKKPITERKSLVSNGYAFDMLPNSDGTIYLCVTEESCNRAVSFKFLESVRHRCRVQGGKHANLAEDLQKELDFFNSSQNTKIREILSGMEDVKSEMVRNVDKVIERGDGLDTLLLKSDELEGESKNFFDKARSFKNQLVRKRIIIYIIVAIVALALVFFIILMACSKNGTNFDRCRASQSDS